MAGGAIQSFLKDVAGAFFSNDYLRDYTHASKTFRPGLYQNAPKYKFLFHVYFDINNDVLGSKTAADNNFGILVKTARLPSYSFNTHEMNQYNRKRIVQTKVKYDPVEITFHDDNDNFITSLWYKYFTYYYADATKPKVVFAGKRGGRPAPEQQGGGVQAPPTGADYFTRTQYQPSITGNDNWGYIGETSVPSPDQTKRPFFNNITIFGLSRHNFTAYTLINPIITRFGHDTYNYDEGAGIMQNTMTLEYETVVYNQGAIDGNAPDNIVTGFGNQTYYDRKTSPIQQPGSNSNILGPGGLLAGAGGTMQQFAGGQILAGIQSAGKIYNGLKNVNLKQQLKSELKLGITNALTNSSNNKTRDKLFDIPVYGQTPSNQGTAGAPTSDAKQAPPTQGGRPTAGVQEPNPYRDGGG